MPEQELVRRPDTEMDRFARLGSWLAASETDSPGPNEKGAAAALRLYLAHELGLPLRAAGEISVIRGKLVVSVQLMRALARQAGYHVVRVDESPTAVTAAVIDLKSGEELGRTTFTLDQAKRAGLVRDGGGWAKYPERMLWARAAGYVMRDVIPDVALGLVTPDEAAEIDGRVILEEDVPEPEPEPAQESDVAEVVARAKEAYDATETTPATDSQRRKMHALFREKGADRAQRLAFCAEVAGRDIKSSTDLSKEEVGRIIDQLEAMPTPATPEPEPEPEPVDNPPAAETRLNALSSLVAEAVTERAITVRELWTEIAGYRQVRPLDLIVELGGQDGAGHLQWLPLRNALQPDEVGDLTRYVENARRDVGLPDDIPF